MFERLKVAIRLRESWEAGDLGFILVRSHWRAAMVVCLTVMAPISIAILFVFPDHVWIAPLVIWWLKPALDRLVLHILAKATFGDVPTVLGTLRQSWKLLRHGLVATLLWRRLSPQRSFVLPVWQLEEQSGAGFRKRCRVLLRKGRIQAIFLTLVCFFFTLALSFAILFGIAFFAPSGADSGFLDAVFGSGDERRRWADILLACLPILAMAIVEPFYVAAGFTLYLNRRVELEGWDLELAFRSIAARALRVLARGVAGFLMVLFLAGSTTLQANPGQSEPNQSEPAKALRQVLRDPEFPSAKREKGLHWKAEPEQSPEENSTPWNSDFPYEKLFKGIGLIAKWAIISGAVLAMAYVLWRNRKVLMPGPSDTDENILPDTLFGMDIRPENLPADLETVASRLWGEGHIRAALALLYRGALAHLVHRRKVSLSKGATEHDCLLKARQALPPASADYFARLTQAWQSVAYAGMVPGADSEGLCSEWERHFRNEKAAS